MYEHSFIVADDNAADVKRVCDLLAELGRDLKQSIRCLQAFSGSEVLDLLVDSPGNIDGLFLDFDFPGGMNGEEVLHRIEDPFGQIFVVLMSGHDEKILENVVKRGFQGRRERFFFLQKPITSLMLQHAFDRAVAYRDERPLPFLLAYPYMRINNPESLQSKVTAIKDFFEAALIYSSILLLAELRYRKGLTPLALPIKNSRKITMGGWLNLVNELRLKMGRSRAHFIPELRRLLAHKDGPMNVISAFKSELRDPIVGHGITMDESVYEELAAPYLEPALALAQNLSFTARYPIFVVDDLDYREGEPRPYRFRSRLLMGTQYPFASVNWTSESPHQKHHVYLWRHDGKTMPLHPFMRVRPCPSCRKDQVFFPVGLTPQQIEYQSVCNHRMSLTWD